MTVKEAGIRPESSDLSHPIAIIGMGCMFPRARDLRGYWRLLRRGENAISETPEGYWSPGDYLDPDPKSPDKTYCARGGFLDPVIFDPTEFGIPPAILEATDTSQLLSLAVAKAALEDAGYGEGREFDRSRVSTILGITGLQELAIPLAARLDHPNWRKALREAGVSEAVAEDVVARIADQYVPWQENSFPGLLGNVVAGRIANRLNLHGTNCVVDAACASSLSAVHLAMLELAGGRANMALAGGVDTLNHIFMFMCFSKTPALSPTGDARPFSEDADGTVLGEGIGMVVLKRLADAQRDGDRIYAVLRGIGTSSDGRSQSIYAPYAAGQARALRDAYRLSGCDPSSIGMIEAHGTGTQVGDAVEFDAVSGVFRESCKSEKWCALGSVKSQIGHTKAAAGVAGLIKAALALHHRAIPPTIKIEKPNGKMDIPASPFYLNTQLRPWTRRDETARRAGVSSFGFGGSNFHAVLEESPLPTREPAWDKSVQIIAISAESQAELSNKLEAWAEWARQGSVEPHEFAYRAMRSRQEFSNQDEWRLIIVTEPGDNVAKVIEGARAKLENSLTGRYKETSLFLGSGPVHGHLAFLFPGQGSQYVGMLRDLVCTFPEAFEALERAGSHLAEMIYPLPALDEEQRVAHGAALTSTETAQPALGAVSLAAVRVLERFNIRSNLTLGHSYGELPALFAAGRIDEEALRGLSAIRGRLMRENAPTGGAMLAVRGAVETIEQLMSSGGLDVVIANRNSSQQVVLSGSEVAIASAESAMRAAGLATMRLPVASAFHSRFMRGATAPFRDALDSFEIRRGKTAAYSNVSGGPHPDDANSVRELLADQLTSMVDFVGCLRNLYDSGVRTFVEVGPRAVLCGLVGDTLGNRPHTAISIDASNGHGDGIADLARVLAQLAAAGHEVDLTKWERDVAVPRKPKMVVELTGANYRSTPRRFTEPSDIVEKNMNQVEPAAVQPVNSSQAPQPASSSTLSEAVRVVQDGMAAMQALQEQTAAAHQRFLESQEQAHRVFQNLIEGQYRLIEMSLGRTPAAAAPLSAPTVHVPRAPLPQSPVPHQKPQPVAIIAPPPVEVTKTIATASAPVHASCESAVLNIVCEKTGYPREMIELDMDIEADLGIDSIKRVEIIAAVEERVPGFRGIKPDQMGAIRTLRQIVAFMDESAGTASPPKERTAPAPVAVKLPAPAVGAFSETLLDVVSQLTGYPREMLELDMDIEADLGIDSIKRVEILAGVESRVPGATSVKPDHMGSLRTLRQIADYFEANTGSSARSAHPSATAAANDPRTPSTEARVRLRRRVLSAVALPKAVPQRFPVAKGRVVLVTEDGGRFSRHVAEELSSRGVPSRLISLGDAVGHEVREPMGGLIVISPAASDLGGAVWGVRSEQFLKQAFLAAKSAAPGLRDSGGEGGALLATVSRMDGKFGLSGGAFDPIVGGLAGLAKTASHEWAGVTCRAIDVALAWSDDRAAAKALVKELSSEHIPEVGLDSTGRYGLQLADDPIEFGDAPLRPGDVVIVTGGARGVTAEAAMAAARVLKPTLILVGRTKATIEPGWLSGVVGEAAIKQAILVNEFAGRARPSPAELERAYVRWMGAREIGKTIDRIRSFGGKVEYVAADVCDEGAVRTLVETIRGQFGPIRGLIHGAGVLEDRRIEDKSAQQFDRVFDTKVAGLRNLLMNLATDELRQVVLFSSVSARFGNPGQVDYSMANEALNKVAQWLSRQTSVRVCAINWGPWDGGMVNAALKRHFRERGVDLIPLGAGATAMVEEMNSSLPAVEVVLGDGWDAAPKAGPSQRDETPLITVSGSNAGRPDFTMAFERRLDIDRHAFLRSHVLSGRPVLPAAMMLEWMGHAAVHMNPGMILLGLDEFRVVRGVAVEAEAPVLRLMTSRLTRSDQGHNVQVELRSGHRGEREILHARATAILGANRPAPPKTVDRSHGPLRPYSRTMEEVYSELLFHGAQLHGIQEVHGISRDGMSARLRPAAAPVHWMTDALRSDWLTDPLVLDAAFQIAILWCREELGEASLPAYVGRYRQFRGSFPREGVDVSLEVRERARNRMTGDFTFFDVQGQPIARIEGYECTVDCSLRAAFRSDAAEAAAI